MSIVRLVRALALGVVALATWGSGIARAEDDREVCARVSEDAQRQRLEGRLLGAREAFSSCTQSKCPGVIRTFCDQQLTELEGEIPTLVVAVQDEAGRDMTGARLYVDRALVAEDVRGLPIAVDPGEHTLTLQGARGEHREQRIVCRAGEKRRPVLMRLAPPPPPPPVAPRPERPAPALAIVLGGVGVASLVTSASLVLWARSDEARMRSTCAPACSRDDYDAFDRKVIAGDVALGVGALALAGAAWVYLTRPEVWRPR